MAPDGCYRPLTAKAGVRFQVGPCEICGKVALGQVFVEVLLFSPVSIMPPMLHTDPHLHIVLTSRTNGRSLETSPKTTLFGNRGAPDRKGISSFFPGFKKLKITARYS